MYFHSQLESVVNTQLKESNVSPREYLQSLIPDEFSTSWYEDLQRENLTAEEKMTYF